MLYPAELRAQRRARYTRSAPRRHPASCPRLRVCAPQGSILLDAAPTVVAPAQRPGIARELIFVRGDIFVARDQRRMRQDFPRAFPRAPGSTVIESTLSQLRIATLGEGLPHGRLHVGHLVLGEMLLIRDQQECLIGLAELGKRLHAAMTTSLRSVG